MNFKLKQPDLSLISEERKKYLNENIFNIFFKNDLKQFSDKRYYFWDKIRFQKLPNELKTHEELWYILKFFRNMGGNRTIVNTEDGNFFKLNNLDFLGELLHKMDLGLGGTFLGTSLDDENKKKFLQNGVENEAISSSQIEGVLTSSKVAREMILKGRRPVGKDEIMILNNYNAMKFVNDESDDGFKNKKITEENFLELQYIITKGTLKNKDEEGRFRKDSDEIEISNPLTGEVFHSPPSEKFLKKELKTFIKYANDEDGEFTHPFVKAIILHFWIGYFHPFCDGNGRTARLIFYWYLLKKGYWGFSYIPISAKIKESKGKYENAYLFSEQDGLDLTYFVSYLANKTEESFDDFEEYLKKKREIQKDDFSKVNHLNLNYREKKLIAYFLKNPSSYTNNKIYKNYSGIAIDTAKKDLENLLKRGFLTKEKQGIFVNYFPVKNLKEVL